MFRPLACYIGLRYTRAKRRNHFISFISLISMLGIALGVTALITVLSVMNGFDKELRERILGMAAHATITGVEQQISDWPQIAQRALSHPEVVGVAPYVRGQGLLSHHGRTRPTFVQGILPAEEVNVSTLATHMVEGDLDSLVPGDFNIVVGKRLADGLGLELGEKVTVVIPESTVTPAGVLPRFKRFTVTGVFEAGYDFDGAFTFIHLDDAARFFRLGDNVSGVRLEVDDLYIAPRVVREVANTLPGQYYLSDWTREHGNFFEAVKLEKTLMFLLLMLIIAVAAFNMLATLVMVVTDKKYDIAILRTLGASPRSIMGMFMVQGTVIGFVGTLLGLLGGIVMAFNITDWVDAIENFFHVKLMSSDIYYISFLPSHLLWSDVLKVCLIALALSFFATLYPAWRASRTQPAEALRYE